MTTSKANPLVKAYEEAEAAALKAYAEALDYAEAIGKLRGWKQ